jgi:hypothetical protein
VVVLVALLTIVVSAVSIVTFAPTRKRGAGSSDRSETENPASHKRHTSNFGPHRSMFLSIGINRVQVTTLINLNEQGQMEEIDQLRKLKQHWVP